MILKNKFNLTNKSINTIYTDNDKRRRVGNIS